MDKQVKCNNNIEMCENNAIEAILKIVLISIWIADWQEKHLQTVKCDFYLKWGFILFAANKLNGIGAHFRICNVLLGITFFCFDTENGINRAYKIMKKMKEEKEKTRKWHVHMNVLNELKNDVLENWKVDERSHEHTHLNFQFLSISREKRIQINLWWLDSDFIHSLNA